MRQRTDGGLFRTSLVLVLALVFQGCGVPPPEDPNKPKPIPEETRVKWFQDCWSDFNTNKWDEFKKCYAPSSSVRQLGFGSQTHVTGPDAIAASGEDFAKSFPDGHGEGQLILVNGPHLAAVYFLSGTNTGPLTTADGKEKPPTRKGFGLLFAQEIESEVTALKPIKEMDVMDSATFASQLGLSKMPARPVMEKGEAVPKIVIAKNDDGEKKNLDADKSALDAWTKHNADGYGAFVADDCIFHDMTRPQDMNKADSAALDQGYWTAFPDARIDAASSWTAGDYVVIVGNFNGTNDGDFPAMKLKHTGRRVSVPFVQIDRVSGGKLKEQWLFFDSANMAAQLNPPPTKN